MLCPGMGVPCSGKSGIGLLCWGLQSGTDHRSAEGSYNWISATAPAALARIGGYIKPAAAAMATNRSGCLPDGSLWPSAESNLRTV
jgi:hypothetical protein